METKFPRMANRMNTQRSKMSSRMNMKKFWYFHQSLLFNGNSAILPMINPQLFGSEKLISNKVMRSTMWKMRVLPLQATYTTSKSQSNKKVDKVKRAVTMRTKYSELMKIHVKVSVTMMENKFNLPIIPSMCRTLKIPMKNRSWNLFLKNRKSLLSQNTSRSSGSQ